MVGRRSGESGEFKDSGTVKLIKRSQSIELFIFSSLLPDLNHEERTKVLGTKRLKQYNGHTTTPRYITILQEFLFMY